MSNSWGLVIVVLDGRKTEHFVAIIEEHAFKPLWQAETTVCGKAGPWHFAQVGGRQCGACMRNTAGAFDAAPEHLKTRTS